MQFEAFTTLEFARCARKTKVELTGGFSTGALRWNRHSLACPDFSQDGIEFAIPHKTVWRNSIQTNQRDIDSTYHNRAPQVFIPTQVSYSSFDSGIPTRERKSHCEMKSYFSRARVAFCLLLAIFSVAAPSLGQTPKPIVYNTPPKLVTAKLITDNPAEKGGY